MVVRWTPTAANDLTHICDYTERRFGPAQARRAAVAVFDAADSLAAMPNRGRKGRRPNTRELSVVGLPFVIVYRVSNETVQIVRIVHGAQQWPEG